MSSNAKKKLKVVFIHPDLGIGGAERLVLDVAGAFVANDIQVKFFTNHFDSSHAFEELQQGLYQVEVYGDWLPRHIFGRFQALCAYMRMVFLALICLWFGSSEDSLYFVDLIPMAIPILKLAGRKVIYYCHHPDLLASTPEGKLKEIYRKPIDFVERVSTGYADVILVNSEYTASVFRRTFPTIRKTLKVVYPTVAATYLETVKSIQPQPIGEIVPGITSKTAIVFLSINRFHPAKKLDLAVLAMAELKASLPKNLWLDTFLVLAGGFDPQSTINSEYFNLLTKLVTQEMLQENVIFLKSPSDLVKSQLLLSCDCLVYTPVNEHFGIVPLEAMTASKPVIACNSGGPRETVQDGKTGFLCEPTPKSLADAMKKILQDREKAKELGRQGKINMEKFSYDAFVAQLKKIADDLSVQ